MLPDLSIKERLHSGASFKIGCASVGMSEAQLQQHLSDNPCDLLFVDLQHAPYTEPQLVTFCHAAAQAGAPALLRLRHPQLVCQASALLDFGAAGVLVPMTERPETVADALASFYYPPVGGRSVGLQHALGWDAFSDPRAYADWWNEHGVLALQIETVAGVERVRGLALPGVDLLLFGATDLGFSLAASPGCPWRTVEECQQHVLAQTCDLKVRVGVGEAPFGRF